MRDGSVSARRCFVSLVVCLAVSIVSSWLRADAAESTAERERTSLDAGWLFHRGDITPADPIIAPAYDDAQWQHVDVPHDYILDGAFDQKQDRGHGYRPIDIGWYRKRIVIPESAKGKLLSLDFDGVFRDSQVWLNGKLLGRHQSGYTPFSFDITAVAKIGGENTIALRVDPRESEGWWYEGGGIYRHVFLTAQPRVHLAKWGTHVIATVTDGDRGATDEAKLTIQTGIENGTADADASACKIVSEIVGPDGESLKPIESSDQLPAFQQREITQQTTIAQPKLWSIESPQLYQLRTKLSVNGKVVDRSTTSFGIRTIGFDADKGFFLNGKHVLIQGTASHQDFAGVGVAVPDSLQEWRVRQLKSVGCNAWRTAHNPPSEALLDACDRLGMLVMDENRHLGDSFGHHSPKGTKSDDLSDLATMVRRDRDHPSIIMWSMCNEEGLQGQPEGVEIFTKMMKVVHRYDQTRPITSAMNNGWLKEKNNADVEDIIGVNYNTNRYDEIRKRHPKKMIFGSEDTNEKTTRGEYADVKETGMRSCFNLSEKDWLAVVERPWMAGSFTWTGFDYKGEPNPYGWPDISNNTGLLDVCGFRKDKAYYFQSCWTDKPMVHLLPTSWKAPAKEGEQVRVMAFSNAKSVELFLNGKSLGSKDVPHDAHVEWNVTYEPGELLAKASNDGKEVATDSVNTTGPATKIELAPDRTTLTRNAQDAIVVPVTILDDKGRIVADADNRVTFKLTGGGRILGVGNGNPADHDPDKAEDRKAFHGRCMAVVQAGADAGKLEITATSPGLSPASVSFDVR